MENRIDSIPQDQIVYLWYLDGQNVIAGSINPYDSTLYIATVVDSIDQNIYKVYAYTTKQGFIDFGDQNGFNHRSMIEFEERMDEARQNGEPSESQILRIYEDIFGNVDDTRANFLFGHDFCAGHGENNPFTTIGKYMPLYAPGWGNKVSSLSSPLAVYYGFWGFDRRWFFKSLGVFWTWSGGPAFPICLPFWMDNKVESSIKFLW